MASIEAPNNKNVSRGMAGVFGGGGGDTGGGYGGGGFNQNSNNYFPDI